MLPSLRSALLALALATPVAAQTALTPSVGPDPVYAGTYHMATGTWSYAPQGSANFGPLTIFDNTAPANGTYNGLMQSNHVETLFDEGRVPTPGDGTYVGTNDGYIVNGFQVGYCTDEVAPDLRYQFYGNYPPCTDATGSSTGPVSALFDLSNIGLPGSTTGTTMCFMVDIDLTGTPDEFCLLGDGADGAFDGNLASDSFGFSMSLGSNVSNGTGPLLRGDPNNVPEGDGTFYQNPSAPIGTGLGIQDIFYTLKPTGSACVFFGGYPAAAFTSLHMRLYARTQDCAPAGPIGTSACIGIANSSGQFADVTAEGSTSIADELVTLRAQPVPTDVPGIFYYGPNLITVPFGDGFRCVGGGTNRLPLQFAVGNTLQRTIDFGTPQASGIIPGTLHFQAWFRDNPAMMAGFNLSDALTITFTP